MKRIKKWLPVVAFCVIIFSLTGRGLTAEEKTYSSSEKRELQTMPKAKVKTIKNGKFQKLKNRIAMTLPLLKRRQAILKFK